MTTDTVSFREFALMRIAHAARNRARRAHMTTQAIPARAFLGIIRVVLHLAGFGLLTMAGFSLSMIAGYITAGLSCFVFSTLMGGGTHDDKGGNG